MRATCSLSAAISPNSASTSARSKSFHQYMAFLRGQYGQVELDELGLLHAYAPIDDAQVDRRRLAEDERGNGVVDRAASQGQRVEAVADEIRRHAGREEANVVAAQNGGAAPRRQAPPL